ncbi:hypothetical protein SmJEL517_g03970 [Synchytrium microbalum]|uniref:ZZ-type domain-containing protein n=1 Tax=Synchytrium microbalum TaxID=1806994 RepID=A0A507BW10_9FUNG|nr:uncharacterized protein SmJEL517_g03970 [Synchytrium microbalum]TPX33037.1 hypothetical protein SmJEL517_g03970 [Synchytrium microbalum]
MSSIKVSYNGTIRKITIQNKSWLSLEEQIRRAHALPSGQLLVTYIDEEFDPIAIDSDSELLDFLNHYSNSKVPKLNVNVRDPDSDSFEVVSNDEVAKATDASSIKSSLPAYSESTVIVAPVIDIDVDSSSVHSAEEKGKLPLYPTIDAEAEASRGTAFEKSQALRQAEEEAAAIKLKAEEEAAAAAIKAKAEAEERFRREVEELAAKRKAAEEEAARKAAEAEAAYQAFVGQVQPLIEQTIALLEENPQYIGRLLNESNSNLASRGFGLLLSGGPTATPAPSCGRRQAYHGHHGHGHHGPYGKRGGRCARRANGDAPDNQPAVWSTVTCDSCGKSGWAGERFVCLNCPDFDLCGECHTRAGEVHNDSHVFERLADPSVRWYGVACDGCGRNSFPGSRFICTSCPDYDLCARCHERSASIHDTTHKFEKIADPGAVHKQVSCDGCNARNFGGPRFKCTHCPDFDLCIRCFTKGLAHPEKHQFRKIELNVARSPELVTLASPAPRGAAEGTSGVDPRIDLLTSIFGTTFPESALQELLALHGSVERVVEALLV